MDLGTFLARKAVNNVRANHALRLMRVEHNVWARTATIGSTWYTALPIGGELSGHTSGHYAPYHMKFVIEGRATGWLGYQFETTAGLSWRLWSLNGPFTQERRPTYQDTIPDETRMAAWAARAQAGVAAETGWDASWAEVVQKYPASAAAMAA